MNCNSNLVAIGLYGEDGGVVKQYKYIHKHHKSIISIGDFPSREKENDV